MFPKALPSSSQAAALSSRSAVHEADREQRETKALLNHTRHNVEKLGANDKGFTPLTAEQAANNILGFIARQLERDKAAGASAEELESRLQAGLRGFKQGFAEAQEKLQALSMLSPPVAESINKTYDLVLTGIDQMAVDYLGHTLLDQSQDTVSLSGEKADVRKIETPAWQMNYAQLQAQSFHFELLTREGDRVTISASREQATGVSVDGQSASLAHSSASRFSLTVEGHLSAEERTAIEHLLGQVDDLAKDFYSGDLEGAFASALALGYDAQQVSSFSLNLMRVDIQRVNQAYGEQGTHSPLQQQLVPLGQFVNKLEEALETAGMFARPVELLTELAEQMTPDMTQTGTPSVTSFREFIEQLLADIS